MGYSLKQVRAIAPIGMLECWNNGRVGFGILQSWINGRNRSDDKIDKILSKTTIPTFHYSTIP
jgi:hypothetical protein